MPMHAHASVAVCGDIVCSQQHTHNRGHHLLSHQIYAINHTLAFQMSGMWVVARRGQRKESSLTTAAYP